jgi:gluconolactonase
LAGRHGCVKRKGRIYFSDPRRLGDRPRQLDAESVYRIDPDGTLTRLLTEVERASMAPFSLRI